MKRVYLKRNLISSAVQTGLLVLGIGLLCSLTWAQNKSDRSAWTWNNSDGPLKIEVTVENKVDFNED